MSFLYSKSTGGFYTTAINGKKIPSDAIEITDEVHATLMIEQSSGKIIIADENGYPIAIDTPPHVRTRESLLADVAAKRWQVETGGIVIAGYPIATDRESQAQLTSSYASLKYGLISSTHWKAADGRFIILALAEMEQIVQAVASHVRSCFSAEQAHTEAIYEIEKQTDLDSYNINTGWPAEPEKVI